MIRSAGSLMIIADLHGGACGLRFRGYGVSIRAPWFPRRRTELSGQIRFYRIAGWRVRFVGREG